MVRPWGLLCLGFVSLLAGPAVGADAPLPVLQPKVSDQVVPDDASLFDTKVKPMDVSKIPMLVDLEKKGAKLFFLGERSGLQGWFVFSPQGIQVAYVTPDMKSVVIGGLFTPDGKLLTSKQIEVSMGSSKDLNDYVTEITRQRVDVARAGALPDSYASLSPVKGAEEAKASATPEQGKKILSNAVLPPGERLLQDLQASAGVNLGKEGAPVLYMVVSPTCPHCKKTWEELRGEVAKDTVQVKLIVLTNGDPERIRVAGRLLQSDKPLEAWNKFIDGDGKMLEGKPDDLHVKAASSVDAIADKWDIRMTPYLAYRSKEGKVKIVQGRPDRVATILTDLVR